MTTHRVLVTDKLAEEGLASPAASPGIEVVVNTKLRRIPPACGRHSKVPTES